MLLQPNLTGFADRTDIFRLSILWISAQTAFTVLLFSLVIRVISYHSKVSTLQMLFVRSR
jgi:hypothetical protein